VFFLGPEKLAAQCPRSRSVALAVQDASAVNEARQREQGCPDIVNMQYTSGTTGFPKGGSANTHSNIANDGFWIGACQIQSARTGCIPVPLFHCFGASGRDGVRQPRSNHGARWRRTVCRPRQEVDPKKRCRPQ
jgi:fatty-acyl-CoA synthase